MKQIAFTMKLKPGCEKEYINRHNGIWPELQGLIRRAGISDYSIFLDYDTGTLFACQRVEGDQGSQQLGNDPLVQKWWKYMADIMETHPDNSPVTKPLHQVFHMD